MLSAFGPFVTDFYLPSLPEMGRSFHCPASLVQMSLTTSMIGLASGQLLIGPLTDKYGRKSMLILSMMLFVAACALSIFSPNIFIFNILRFVQGFGGAGGIVLSKSISTDNFTGKELSNFMAIISAINGITPVVAPIVGGTLMSFTTWQGIFVVLLIIGIIITVLSCLLNESLPKDRRLKQSIVHSYTNLFRVFRNRMYVTSMLAQMFCMFMFFAYISSSTFILQQLYGLTPLQFSICFGINAFAIGIGSACTTTFKTQTRCLKCAAIDMLIASMIVAFLLIMHISVYLLMTAYIYLMFSFGLMQVPTTAIAMDSERNNAGSASAILGAAGFLMGGIASPIVCLGNMRYTAGIVIVAGSVLSFIMTMVLCRIIYREKSELENIK